MQFHCWPATAERNVWTVYAWQQALVKRFRNEGAGEGRPANDNWVQQVRTQRLRQPLIALFTARRISSTVIVPLPL